MTRLTKTALLGATMLGLGSAAYAQADVQNAEALDPNATIAENAMKVQNFSTLIAAVEAAGLSDELMGPGPYTVFAPVDSAFAELPEGAVDTLLQPENRGQLEALLDAHVVPGLFTAKDIETALTSGEADPGTGEDIMVSDGQIEFDTLDTGANIFVERQGDYYTVSGNEEGENEAQIIASDIMASNGVIHVIDGVLMPDPADS